MKIVQLGVGAIPVHSGNEFGGTERGVYWVSHHLGRLGSRVYVIDIKGKAHHREEREQANAEFIEVWHPPLRNSYKFPVFQRLFNYLLLQFHLLTFAIPACLALYRLLGREEIQVIHAYSSLPALGAMFINKIRRGQALTVYLLSTAFGTGKLPWYRRLAALLEILAVRWSDHVIVEAPVMKSWVASELGVDPERISQIYSGMALEEIQDYLARAVVAGSQGPTVLCVGSVAARKNQLSILKTIPQVAHAHPEVKFVFVGPVTYDRHWNEVQEFMAENNLSDHVEVTGEVTKEELYRHYSQATVFMLPSRAEMQGLALVEAMAFGLPVIASNIEPFKNMTDGHPDCAILLDPDDVDGMANTLLRLLEDEEIRHRISHEAREVAKSFDWRRVAANTLDLYEDLVTRRKARLLEAKR